MTVIDIIRFDFIPEFVEIIIINNININIIGSSNASGRDNCTSTHSCECSSISGKIMEDGREPRDR